jgi:hypothetical protein
VKEHLCGYNHNRSEPCGKIARFKFETKHDFMWFCAEHYDETVSVFEQFGLSPEDADPINGVELEDEEEVPHDRPRQRCGSGD